MIKESSGLLTKAGASIPLTGVEVRGNITGHSTIVKVIQNFHNGESRALEAVYKFPLPEGGSICGFKATIGEKIIQGEVEDKEQAFKLYDEALTRGDGAYLLDQERPNIFTLSLGNLNPGVFASIEIEYVTLLDAHNSEARFVLPTTISPRYLPPDTKDEKGIPVKELINPPVALEVSYGLKIFLDIQGRENIQSLESPSHSISTTFLDNSIRVELASDNTIMDRDFILNIKYRKDCETAGYLSRKDKDYYIQVDFSPKPPSESLSKDISDQEIIFVLDCSGSMGGSSITEAKRALEILLKALETGTSFNIYRFGSTFSSLFTTSVPYQAKNLDTALQYLSGIGADLGGTEILSPLEAIRKSLSPEKITNIVLLTDGQVGNEEQIINLVRAGSSRMRMFTVGIGNGPNEYFIKQLARSTGGAAEMISPDERIEPRVLRLFSKISSMSNIQDLKINWGAAVMPAGIPYAVFYGETASIFARLEDHTVLPERIIVSGLVNKSRQEWVVNIIRVEADNIPLPFLWAKARIRELEESETVTTGSQQLHRKEGKVKQSIIDLSKAYGIISRETSFIAVEKRLDSEKTTGEVILRKVPVMLTHGWGGLRDTKMNSVILLASPEAILCEDTPAYMRRPQRVSRKKLNAKPKAELNYMVSRSDDMTGTTEDDALLSILALQKAEGGFEIDAAFTQILKIALSDLHNQAVRIQTKGNPEKFTLLSTAIILKYLEYQFAEKKSSWEAVTRKSQRWLEEQILKTEPTIEGKKLVDWTDQFLGKQGLVSHR